MTPEFTLMEIQVAYRILVKRLFLNLIKVAGLGLALSGIVLILLFIKSELSYDRFHEKSERIFRLTVTHSDKFEGKHFARVFLPDFVPAMTDFFPTIENYVRLMPIRGGVIKHNEKFIRINQAFRVDSTFFRIFDAELISGNKTNILDNPAVMVVSETFAERVFGEQDPVGKTLRLSAGQYYGKNTDFTVKGVMKDFPRNSHFHPEFIVTAESNDQFMDWSWTYLLINSVSDPNEITERFNEFYAINSSEDSANTEVKAWLQPIRNIHLKSDKLREIETNSNIIVILSLLTASLILLFISLTNYVNLNMGMAAFSGRYLQTGSIFGASQFNRLKYYLAESIMIIASSILLGVVTVLAAHFLLLKHFSINLLQGNSWFIFTVVLLFALLCLIAGLLPFIKQQTLQVFAGSIYKNKASNNIKGISPGLIVLQYAISTALMISVIMMMRQTNFALKKSMGENSGHLICFENMHTDVQAKFGIFKQEVLKFNSIREVTAMLDPPGGEANDMFGFELEGYTKGENEDVPMIGVLPCDYSFARAFDLKVLAGEDFTPEDKDSDGSGEFLINHSALKRLGFSKPEQIIGKNFKLLFDNGNIRIPSGKITGVVADFHLSGVKKKVEPLVMFKRGDIWLINFIVSIEPGMGKHALASIEQVWERLFPDHPLEYRYLNVIYRDVYRSELLQTVLIFVFTIMALFISSMGLLGLSLLSTQRRTKEIGIRVVNGASAGRILRMLNWYFIRWILLSFVIAVPAAWYGMNKWLENFEYKLSPAIWIFALAGLLTIMIALVTVSLQSWKAANRNPVEALRYE